MKNFKKRIAIGFLAVLMAFSGTACKRKPITQGSSSSNDITILCSAAVGQPTTANDPYKKYIKDKLQDKFVEFENVCETGAGCVISSHCGSGCIGILYIVK